MVLRDGCPVEGDGKDYFLPDSEMFKPLTGNIGLGFGNKTGDFYTVMDTESGHMLPAHNVFRV